MVLNKIDSQFETNKRHMKMNKQAKLLATMVIVTNSIISSVHADELHNAIESLSNGKIEVASQLLTNAENAYLVKKDIYTSNDTVTEIAAVTTVGAVRALQLVVNDCKSSKLPMTACKEIGSALKLMQNDNSEPGLKRLSNVRKQNSNNPAIVFLATSAQFQRARERSDLKMDTPAWEQFKGLFVGAYSGVEPGKLAGHFLFERAVYKASIAPLLSKKVDEQGGARLHAYLGAYNDFSEAGEYIKDKRFIAASWRASIGAGRGAMRLMLRNVVYLVEGRLADRSDFRDALDTRTKQLRKLGINDISSESGAESAFYYFYEFLDWLKKIGY